MCLLTVYHIIRFITNVYKYCSLNVENIRNLIKDISGFVTPVTFSNGGTRKPYLTVVASVIQKYSILFELTNCDKHWFINTWSFVKATLLLFACLFVIFDLVARRELHLGHELSLHPPRGQ